MGKKLLHSGLTPSLGLATALKVVSQSVLGGSPVKVLNSAVKHWCMKFLQVRNSRGGAIPALK
ncbi:MAG: hypothetical protein ACRC62_11015 [Microcoleus sp.]